MHSTHCMVFAWYLLYSTDACFFVKNIKKKFYQVPKDVIMENGIEDK